MRRHRVRRSHRRQLTSALVEDQVEPEERLQPSTETRSRPSRALRDRADPPARGAVEVQDPVGLAVANAAQDDRLGLDGARQGPRSVTTGSDERLAALNRAGDAFATVADSS